jgi:TolB-like protein
MKRFFSIFMLLHSAVLSSAQTNEPARLALLAESSGAADASDVLTAQLSSEAKVRLLERNEIEKVYREQGLSAENKDYLKLGHILGADGLLLLDVVRTKHETNLNARLIAVKSGVVLSAEKYSWFTPNVNEWSSSYANHLNLFLPKLSLLVKDAIPISVVNFRCAVQSTDAPEVERQLKLLAIQRLSQERQFFVLERQRLQLLGDEKELKLDDSAFWNGSYLLEGVVDQNGHARETITINARLTPPKGGAPLLIEVSGSRTNFAEVINRLAAKVDEALKINATASEWKGAEEAAQYFDEAKWALKWGVLPEAQAAAESAWALGKRDPDCAIVRVRAYVLEVSEVSKEAGDLKTLDATYSPGFNADGVAVGPPPSDAYLRSKIKKIANEHPWGLTYKIESQGAARTIHYAFAETPPDPKNLDRALHALDLYYEFSRNSPEEGAKVDAKRKNSDWYNVGVEDLVAASQVLQNFNFLPQATQPVSEKLAELRALARKVAAGICTSSSVHDSYFVGDRVVTHDELSHTMQENPNIFRCKVNWGCYWQEKPEDAITLYRELMSSPVFCYLHQDLWLRPAGRPRLVAWNENDLQRIPAVWGGFVRELESSPDIQLQLEAKAFAVTDASSEPKMADAFTNFFNSLIENREALLTNNVEVVYLGWGAGALVPGSGVVSDVTESLQQRYRSEYWPKLQAMDQDYWTKTIPATHFSSVFQQQEQYLKDNKPYEFFEFAHLFGSSSYSKIQALEIQPLIVAYKSNLVVQSQNVSGTEKGKLRGAIAQVGFLEARVNNALNPPVLQPQPSASRQVPKPASVAQMPTAPPASTNTPEIVTNVLTVNKFLVIPMDGLQSNGVGGVIITAHHWVEGKLLLDLKYGAAVYLFDTNGKWRETRDVTYAAIAILDPKTKRWDVVGCSEVDLTVQSRFYHRSTLWRNELFTCDGNEIKKYDFKSRQWKGLEISDGRNYELFTVNEHLYAANRNTVFEITDDGKATRLLASTRRQPPVSVLDTQDLGTPTLFQGPEHSLRIVAAKKIFTWTGNDWHEDADAPSAESPPETLSDCVLFVTGGFYNQPAGISRLATESNAVEVCLEQETRPANMPNFSRPGAAMLRSPKPTWERPPNTPRTRLPTASRQSDLYLLVDHSEARDIVNEQQHVIVGRKVIAKGGYHAELLCFSRDMPLPQKLFLRFDDPDGCPPAAGSPAWMLSAEDYLFFGLESPPIGFLPAATPTEDGYKAGVWLMPVSQLQPK